MRYSLLIAGILALLSLNCRGLSAAPASILVEVTGGKVAVTDCIVERRLDTAAAAKVLAYKGAVDPRGIRVVEVDSSGNELRPVASQVNPAEVSGKYTVCWQLPGELVPGQIRRFKILLGGEGEVPPPAVPIVAQSDGTTTTVKSGNAEIAYSKWAGGMPTKVAVNGVTGELSWSDKLHDGGNTYYLSNHEAVSARLLASGPLRVVYEAESTYKNGDNDAPSGARAVYRFTHYAGQPVVRVEGVAKQDFAKQWPSLNYLQMHFDSAPVDSYATDTNENGRLAQTGTAKYGTEWAAVYGDRLLIGLYGTKWPKIYDGGGPHYKAYIESGLTSWNTLSYSWKYGMFVGGGYGEIEAIGRWGKLIADEPVIRVRFAPLDQQIAKLTTSVNAKKKNLEKLSGKEWAAGYIRMHVAQLALKDALMSTASGDFGAAAASIAEVRSALDGKGGKMHAVARAGVISGVVDGHPFLSNANVAVFWDKTTNGAGLISIYDKRSKREFLGIAPGSGDLWQLAVKKGNGGTTYTGRSSSCSVIPVAGGIDFKWTRPVKATITARLAAGWSGVRMRLNASTDEPDEGLQSVAFPVIGGIRPVTKDASGDVVLDTTAVGDAVASPLVSGRTEQVNYPDGMQFSAVLGGGLGLYIAEEDPQANKKSLTWTPDRNAGVLEFAISHPVLGWGGDGLVKSYSSPGDVVICPFKGDWYDAAQIYRRWALTAPWCAKGPMHSRKDYPKWLADAPYWTIGYFGNEDSVEVESRKFDFFGLPVGACHVYDWFFPVTMDDMDNEFFPPKLGVEGLKQMVKKMRSKGMRCVPYVCGYIWDQDTENYRVQDAENKAALCAKDGKPVVITQYGGQKMAAMCPATELWREKLTEVSNELVGRYGFDGVYYDFLTVQNADCFNASHDHPLAGGNFWTKSIRELYGGIRAELKKINPEAAMSGEYNAEFVVDLLDTTLAMGRAGTKAPLFQAVYHGYTLLYGGQPGGVDPAYVGRWWLLGNQSGWSTSEYGFVNLNDESLNRNKEYYRRLLHCHYKFGRPYLAYGRMLRMPEISGEMPSVTSQSAYGSYTVPVMEGTAWEAPDGTVGIFFTNYGDKPRDFIWTIDLQEVKGWKPGSRVSISEWTEAGGLKPLAVVSGGKLNRKERIDALGIIALKLEVAK